MKINRIICAILPALVFALTSTSCSDSKGESSSGVTEIVYQAIKIKKVKVGLELVLPGELEGYFETGIMAKVNGYVKHVFADIGDRVVEGQKLAELEAPELKSQLDAAYSELEVKEAMYLNTKGKLARLKQTNRTKGAVSPYDMDLALTNVKSDSLTFVASISHFQAIKSLSDYLVITAPFDGIITEREAAPGSFVGPDDKNLIPLFRLKKESRLRLHVAIPEKHIAETKLWDTVQFEVKSYPDQSFEGRITRLSKSLSTQTRSELIEIEIENHSGHLLPGMYANVTIPLKRKEPTLVVPASALVTNMERNFVIRIKQQKIPEWVDVQKGEEQNGFIEIFGKLNPGDTVLSSASDEIKEDTKIKIIMADQ